MTDRDAFAQLATDVGLTPARLVSLSKSRYLARHPGNAVVFNASIANAGGEHIWWGDVDLTTDEPLLAELARRAGIDLYLYLEFDSRPGFVDRIDSGTAVAVIDSTGHVRLGARIAVARGSHGRIVRRERPPEESEPGPTEASDAQG